MSDNQCSRRFNAKVGNFLVIQKLLYKIFYTKTGLWYVNMYKRGFGRLPNFAYLCIAFRTHTLIAMLQTQVSSIYRESSFKVRVWANGEWGLFFFCPYSWSECKRRLNTPRITSTWNKHCKWAPGQKRKSWLEKAREGGSEHRKLHTLTVVSWQVVVTGLILTFAHLLSDSFL